MGRVLVEIIRQTPGAHLAGAIEQPDSIAIGQDAGLLAGCGQMGVPISGDALATVAGADGILDFTSPQSTIALAAMPGPLSVTVIPLVLIAAAISGAIPASSHPSRALSKSSFRTTSGQSSTAWPV